MAATKEICMSNLKCIEGGLSGQGPKDCLNIVHTGNQTIHPDFAVLETEKLAILAVLYPKTGHRFSQIGPWDEAEVYHAEGR
jgi:hypothetical protein